ncbi:MAG: hypothetical protein AAB217_22365, partial [Chloroflexota bacterium]
MSSFRYLSDKTVLLRQAIVAFLILLASTVIFASTAVLLSTWTQKSELILIPTFIFASSLS